MAVDQDLLDQIAASIADLYREVESSLVTVIADELKKGLDAPTAEVKLGAVTRLRAAAEQVQARLAKTKSAAVREAVRTAYRSGWTSALTSIPTDALTKIKAKEATEQVPNAAIVENIAAALYRDLGRVDGNILRDVDDAYRRVQAATAARIATGTATRRQASQAAWSRLIAQGITSFTDSRGRRWRLSSYAEMIGRTNIQRAAVQGQMDRLEGAGIDLVYISDNIQECKVCRPFESKVLRRDAGPVGRIQVEHGTRDDEMVSVDVVDTLDGARARGLFHPNCRHSASAYLPGITKLKKATQDPDGDVARQQQRALERKIRAEKEQALGALDEAAKKQANARVRAAQAALRAHLAAHPDLKRLPYREQLGAGNTPGPGGPKGGPVSDQPPSTGPTSTKPTKTPAKKAEPPAAKAAQQPQTDEAEQEKARIKAAIAATRKASAKKASATASKVKKLEDLYGDRLRIQKKSKHGPQHAADFARIPDALHDVLAGYVRGVDLGDGSVPDFMPELRGVQPRGWAAGKTWDDVPAAYSPSSRRIIVGGGHGTGHGSESACVHEAGHGLDHALGHASSSPDFQALHADVASQGVKPYYAQAGEAGRQEMWAEAFAAWTMHRDAGAAVRDEAIGRTLGAPASKRAAAGARLSAYFDTLLAREER